MRSAPEGGRHAHGQGGFALAMSMRIGPLLLICLACGVLAQEEVTIDGRPVRLLSDDKLKLAVRSVGGDMTSS